MIGDHIEFDSDPDDDDDEQTHIYTGEIKLYNPQKQTIAIKLSTNGTIISYFIDEIEIKSISSKKASKKKSLHRTSSFEQCISFDTTVFEEKNAYDCDNKCIITHNTNDIIKNCAALNRLISGLKYYQILDILTDEIDQDIFANFVDNIYIKLIDDYNHLDEIHGNQLQQINKIIIQNNLLPRCTLNACLFTARHHKTYNETKIKSTLHPSLNIYKETMDSLHFYLFHQFDCGLMTLKTLDAASAPDIENDDAYNDYDYELYEMQNNINKTKKNTKKFDRYKDGTINKFTIMVDDHHENTNHNSTPYAMPLCAGKVTFMDELNKYLHEIVADCLDVYRLKSLTELDEYDTESIISDIEFVIHGNIAIAVKDTKVLHSIEQFVKNIQLQTASFSIGLIFYYWPYFKDIEEIESFDEENINDHSGYVIKDLYIERKYSSFKEEISNYKYIQFQSYLDIVEKADLYLQSKMAKQLQADVYGHVVHYGIKQGEKLSIYNVISVILYCDYSAHCTDFSGTFRKQTPFEPLKSIKNRNQNFWWMSKILRETVEVYGQSRDGVWDGKNEPKYKHRINKLIGPFFTGLSSEMIVPEFNIRLCSPTSTSKKLEVAIKFGGDNGMVIQLNNPPFGEYELGKAFNCSWVSKYKEEDERLFFGGSWRTKIEAVRMMRSNKNLGPFFNCLTYFDGMLNGSVMDADTIKSRDRKIIQTLLQYNQVYGTNKFNNYDIKLDQYLYQTFDCFVRHKIQIVLALNKLKNYCDKQLRNIIMYPIVWNNKKYKHFIYDKTNLFREVLFQLFPNLTSIIIYSESTTYIFSLIALLSLIELCPTLKEVKIKAEESESSNGFNKSWLHSSVTSSVIQQYQIKGYKISFDKKKCVMSGDEMEVVDILWIRKKNVMKHVV